MSGTEIKEAEIEIEEDFVEEVQPEGETPDVSGELESYSKGVQKRIDEMRAKLGEQERHSKSLEADLQRAISVARQIADENAALKKERASSDEAVFEGLVGSLTSDLTLAKQELRAAHELGDAEKITEATTKLSVLAADLRRAQVAKAGLKLPNRVQNEPNPAPAAQPEQHRPHPAVARKAQEWIARNGDWFQKDAERTKVALAADSYVRALGIDPSSDEYYTEVDKVIDTTLRRGDKATTREVASRDTAASQPVTAQGRSAPAVAGKRKVSLSAEELGVARRMGVSPEDYARAKAAMAVAT